MRCGRNNPTHNSDLSRKMEECLEINHLTDVLRCGNRSIPRGRITTSGELFF